MQIIKKTPGFAGVLESFSALVLHNDLIRKHQDGAEVQDRCNCGHDHVFLCRNSVHLFHGDWILIVKQ